jgi:hypothetical protein
MQEAHYSMWLPIFPTYIQMVIALFPTKTNLWFCVIVLHLASVKGKALKNLSGVVHAWVGQKRLKSNILRRFFLPVIR